MFKRLKNFTISVYQNYFEIASCLGATIIILLAILMDNILGLQACPMCIMTRYVFGIIAVIAFFGFIAKKLFLIDKFLIVLASMAGLAVTGKQIYLQNLSQEEINNLKNDLIKHADLENYIKDPDIGVKVKKSKKVKIKKSST